MGGYWSIGELAKETDVKVVTIRYYEQIGVLSAPRRTAGNYRGVRQGARATAPLYSPMPGVGILAPADP
ncbi:MAG: MerR family DNA-binding transcriptional regulator [Bryobacteraceae bacterium]